MEKAIKEHQLGILETAARHLNQRVNEASAKLITFRCSLMQGTLAIMKSLHNHVNKSAGFQFWKMSVATGV